MAAFLSRGRWLSTSRQSERAGHLCDDIFNCIFLYETVIFIQMPLNSVPIVPINNKPALVQIIV